MDKCCSFFRLSQKEIEYLCRLTCSLPKNKQVIERAARFVEQFLPEAEPTLPYEGKLRAAIFKAAEVLGSKSFNLRKNLLLCYVLYYSDELTARRILRILQLYGMHAASALVIYYFLDGLRLEKLPGAAARSVPENAVRVSAISCLLLKRSGKEISEKDSLLLAYACLLAAEMHPLRFTAIIEQLREVLVAQNRKLRVLGLVSLFPAVCSLLEQVGFRLKPGTELRALYLLVKIYQYKYGCPKGFSKKVKQLGKNLEDVLFVHKNVQTTYPEEKILLLILRKLNLGSFTLQELECFEDMKFSARERAVLLRRIKLPGIIFHRDPSQRGWSAVKVIVTGNVEQLEQKISERLAQLRQEYYLSSSHTDMINAALQNLLAAFAHIAKSFALYPYFSVQLSVSRQLVRDLLALARCEQALSSSPAGLSKYCRQVLRWAGKQAQQNALPLAVVKQYRHALILLGKVLESAQLRRVKFSELQDLASEIVALFVYAESELPTDKLFHFLQAIDCCAAAFRKLAAIGVSIAGKLNELEQLKKNMQAKLQLLIYPKEFAAELFSAIKYAGSKEYSQLLLAFSRKLQDLFKQYTVICTYKDLLEFAQAIVKLCTELVNSAVQVRLSREEQQHLLSLLSATAKLFCEIFLKYRIKEILVYVPQLSQLQQKVVKGARAKN
ncbi:MAG: hypothetical protein GXO42_00555 [bacterium]|nr:hypothetical protein [bacterium]